MTRYFVVVEGHEFTVDVDGDAVRVDGEAAVAGLSPEAGGGSRALLLDGASWHWQVDGGGAGRWDLHSGGRTLEAEVLDERTRTIRALVRRSAANSGPRPLKAPMPGLVIRVEVQEGDEVEAGQGLVVVEAMKMENELKAEVGGRIARVHVSPGDPVEKDQVLVEFVPPEADADAPAAVDGDDELEGAARV